MLRSHLSLNSRDSKVGKMFPLPHYEKRTKAQEKRESEREGNVDDLSLQGIFTTGVLMLDQESFTSLEHCILYPLKIYMHIIKMVRQ